MDEGFEDRLFRTGCFAHYLADRGHDVVWWTSAFDHFRKTQRFDEDHLVRVNGQLEIRMLHGCGYRRNVSVARFRDHRQLGDKYASLIRRQPVPDVIVAGLPTIELCVESVRYGRKHSVPVLVDVRDVWPDIFVDVFPRPVQWLARLGLQPLFRSVGSALRDCTGIIGVSDSYLEWGLRYAGRPRIPADGVFPLGYQRPRLDERDVDDAAADLRVVGVDSTKIICWFVGMFGRTYDLRTVLAAARELESRGVGNVQFVLSGEGDDYEKLVELAQGRSNVVFTGWLSAPQIAGMFRMARIGLMAYAPGAPQGLPNKLFEYLSQGLPILSSLRGETENLLNQYDCGLTYPAGDGHGLATLLMDLIGDERRLKRLSQSCCQLFDRRFRAERICDEMLAHLNAVVNDRRTVGLG